MTVSLERVRAALVLIDMQRDFIHPEGFFARQGTRRVEPADLGGLVGNCQRLIDAMHVAGRPVVFVKQVFRADYADCALALPWIRRGLNAESGFLVEGSWGAELIDGLVPEARDFVVIKKGHSAFQTTYLDRLLSNLAVEQCVVGGGSVSGCISDTVRMGAALGYEQFVVQDAVYPPRSPHLRTLLRRVELVTTEQVVECAAAAPALTQRPAGPGCALVIVDIQNDFLHAEGVLHRYGYSHIGDELRAQIITNNRKLVDAMHARGWPVIFVRLVERPDRLDSARAAAGVRERSLPPDVPFLVQGSWGAEWVEELTPEPCDIVVEKKGHSAFGFTPLHRILRNLRVRRCLVTGGAVSGCLSDTMREGAGLGYDLTILSDATYPPGSDYFEVLANRGEVRTTEEVLAELTA